MKMLMLCFVEGGYHETIQKYQHVQQQDTITRAVLLSPPRQRDGLPPAGQSELKRIPPKHSSE